MTIYSLEVLLSQFGTSPLFHVRYYLLSVLVGLLAESLQLCPTLCDPLDCCLPGSSVPGILQARILGWIALPSSRQEYWSGLPCPPPGDLPYLGIELDSLQFSSVAQLCLTLCDPIKHARPPCPLLTPGVYPNLCPLSQ